MSSTEKYRMYIDEVGNPDLESSENPNHRFLSLTGVIIELAHVEQTIHPEMESIKTRYFKHHPDDPIIFHRKEMINCKGPFESQSDENLRKKFDDDLIDLLSGWDYRVISVCLDKKRLKETYLTWRYDQSKYYQREGRIFGKKFL